MWGRQLVLGMGSDEGHETNAVNMLNMDTQSWESWDGNIQRVGGAMGLLEGKLFLVGGQAIYICIYTYICVCVCAYAVMHLHIYVPRRRAGRRDVLRRRAAVQHGRLHHAV